jgi:hypothetical protein
VVNQGGGWSVSLIQSVLQSLAPFTVSVDSFAAIAEFAAALFFDDSDGFYPAAVGFLGATEPVLAPGTSTITPRAGGEFAVFRVPAGVTVSVAVPRPDSDDGSDSDDSDCFVVVLDEQDADFSGGFDCDEVSEPISAPSTLVLTTSSNAFATVAEIAPFAVTVTPA